MAAVRVPGEQEPRCFVLRAHQVVEHSFELVSVVDLAINRQVHVVHLRGHRALQFAGERAHHAHEIAIRLTIRYVPFGYHERSVVVPILFDVLHHLSDKSANDKSRSSGSLENVHNTDASLWDPFGADSNAWHIPCAGFPLSCLSNVDVERPKAFTARLVASVAPKRSKDIERISFKH